jgi:uncharacterized protein (UPF0303 family)
MAGCCAKQQKPRDAADECVAEREDLQLAGGAFEVQMSSTSAPVAMFVSGA